MFDLSAKALLERSPPIMLSSRSCSFKRSSVPSERPLFSPEKMSYSRPIGGSGVTILFESSTALLTIVLEFFKGRLSAVIFHSSNCSYVIALFYGKERIQLVMDTILLGLP